MLSLLRQWFFSVHCARTYFPPNLINQCGQKQFCCNFSERVPPSGRHLAWNISAQTLKVWQSYKQLKTGAHKSEAICRHRCQLRCNTATEGSKGQNIKIIVITKKTVKKKKKKTHWMSHCLSEERRNRDFFCLLGRGWCCRDAEGREVVLSCIVSQIHHRKSLVLRLSGAINDEQNGCQSRPTLPGRWTKRYCYYLPQQTGPAPATASPAAARGLGSAQHTQLTATTVGLSLPTTVTGSISATSSINHRITQSQNL